MTCTLEQAIQVAAEAHKGQTDKAGEPYILHPLRVMLRGRTEAERIVGVLHDVVEDSKDWSLHRLSNLFRSELVAAVSTLTKREGEPYEAFIARIASASVLARRVKIFDLQDNCNLHRLGSKVTDADRQRVKCRYMPALARLIASLDVCERRGL